MNRIQRPFTERSMRLDTSMSLRRSQDFIKLAAKLKGDVEQEKRIAASHCLSCWYLARGGVAGAAMTSQPCARCGKDQLYGSTRTDALCLPCAKDGDLCKCCGGDVQMRVDRKTWPAAYSEPQA